jgi:hypothetical protein
VVWRGVVEERGKKRKVDRGGEIVKGGRGK